MPLLFTYGSLQKGQSNHRILENMATKFVAFDSIQADLVPTGYPFPAIKRGSGLVTGEVYSVDDDGLAVLDRFEGDPHFYQRRTTTTNDNRQVNVYFGTGVIDSRPEPLSEV
jgi:gamma-glutamylaminecyclotransferase